MCNHYIGAITYVGRTHGWRHAPQISDGHRAKPHYGESGRRSSGNRQRANSAARSIARPPVPGASSHPAAADFRTHRAKPRPAARAAADGAKNRFRRGRTRQSGAPTDSARLRAIEVLQSGRARQRRPRQGAASGGAARRPRPKRLQLRRLRPRSPSNPDVQVVYVVLAERAARGVCRPRGEGGQARPVREADGDQPRRMRAHDRRLQSRRAGISWWPTASSTSRTTTASRLSPVRAASSGA